MTGWRRLAGDEGVFAFELALGSDPDEGATASVVESASWGSFQIWVQGQNLCAHRVNGENSERVHWYTLELIEWFVFNWDALFHEERLPFGNRGDSASAHASLQGKPTNFFSRLAAGSMHDEDALWEWTSRHSLLTARAGGVFPSVFFRRVRDKIELSWDSFRLAGTPEDMAFSDARGVALFDPLEVAKPLYEVISEAVEELVQRVDGNLRLGLLRDEMQKIRRRDSRRDRRLALLAGMPNALTASEDPWTRFRGEIPDAMWKDLTATEETDLVVSGSCQVALMFGCLAPTVDEEDARKLIAEVVALSNNNPDNRLLDVASKCRATGITGGTPWNQGYDLAEEFLSVVGLEDENDTPVPIDNILSDLGVVLKEIGLGDPSIRAIAVAGPRHSPAILLNESYGGHEFESVKRFTLAHELCHLLFDRSHGSRVAIASGPWAPRWIEQRANAFGAMLLMPEQKIVAALHGEPEEAIECVNRVAKYLNVSKAAALEHLTNLNVIQVWERDSLREKLDEAG